jgi:hypothetical protein
MKPAAENDALRLRHLAIKQILVCVDGTDRDRSVLDQALQIALRFDSHIDVLHVRFDVHGTTSDRHERQIDRLLDKLVEPYCCGDGCARTPPLRGVARPMQAAVARAWDGSAWPLESMAGNYRL